MRKSALSRLTGRILAVTLVLTGCVRAANTYYVDPVGGSDSNNGLSSSKPWKTLAKVNSRNYLPGESIRFKAATRSTGMLILRGGGSAAAPITVGRYGSGAMPAIDGTGNWTAVTVENMSHCILEDLEITNQSASVSSRYGVHIQANTGAALPGPTLRRLYIHHVSGHDERGGGAGVLINADPDNNGKPSWFEHTLIEQCHMHNLPFNGILFSGWNTRGRKADGSLSAPSTGLVIRDNLLYDISGDGICLINTRGAIIEHNVLFRGCIGQLRGSRTPSAGIWPHSSDYTIMRYNHVEGLRGTLDGQAFDVDIDCRFTRVENNLSRNNGTGFLLICSTGTTGEGPTTDTLVRGNLSLDDAAEAPGALLTIVSAVQRTLFIHNAFIITRTGSRRFMLGGNWLNGACWPSDLLWRQNLIIAAGQMDWSPGHAFDFNFSGNIWHGTFTNLPRDEKGFHGDPGLLHKPVYNSLNPAIDPVSPASELGFIAVILTEAGLTKNNPWLAARDAAALNNPAAP